MNTPTLSGGHVSEAAALLASDGTFCYQSDSDVGRFIDAWKAQMQTAPSHLTLHDAHALALKAENAAQEAVYAALIHDEPAARAYSAKAEALGLQARALMDLAEQAGK